MHRLLSKGTCYYSPLLCIASVSKSFRYTCVCSVLRRIQSSVVLSSTCSLISNHYLGLLRNEVTPSVGLAAQGEWLQTTLELAPAHGGKPLDFAFCNVPSSLGTVVVETSAVALGPVSPTLRQLTLECGELVLVPPADPRHRGQAPHAGLVHATLKVIMVVFPFGPNLQTVDEASEEVLNWFARYVRAGGCEAFTIGCITGSTPRWGHEPGITTVLRRGSHYASVDSSKVYSDAGDFCRTLTPVASQCGLRCQYMGSVTPERAEILMTRL